MHLWAVEGLIFLNKPGLGIIETFCPLYARDSFFERRAMLMLPKSYIFHHATETLRCAQSCLQHGSMPLFFDIVSFSHFFL
jgi:hypothetical protein